MTEHISFFLHFPKPTLQPLIISPLNALIYCIFKFHNLGTNWSPQKCTNMAEKPVLDGNAFLMLQHERMRARSCHCGLKEMPCFMTCNTVTNLGTLDMARFTGGRHKHRNPQCRFPLGPATEPKVTETHGPQGGED